MENDKISERVEGVGAENVSVLAMCKKHNRPLRKGQRNCDECNRIANRKYKAQLKRDAAAFKAMRKILVASS